MILLFMFMCIVYCQHREMELPTKAECTAYYAALGKIHLSPPSNSFISLGNAISAVSKAMFPTQRMQVTIAIYLVEVR
jgi:hypothetical protein